MASGSGPNAVGIKLSNGADVSILASKAAGTVWYGPAFSDDDGTFAYNKDQPTIFIVHCHNFEY